jgi:hypothetical protein
MSMKTAIETRSNHLYVRVTGVFELQLALGLLGEVLDESVRRGLSGILIDYRGLQGVPSFLTEDFIYAASAAMLVQKYADADGKPPRLAYLAPKSVLKDGEYAVRVAAQFGYNGAKRTTSIDEAMEWLESAAR